MKKLVSMFVCFLIAVSTVSSASETAITAEARYLDSDTIVISGTVSNPLGEKISLVFGDINTMLHVDEAIIEDGEFEFLITLSENLPAYEYTYILTTQSAKFLGTIQTRGSRYFSTHALIQSDIDFSIRNYVPSFSGTATCTPGANVQVVIRDMSDNSEIVNDFINCEDGVYEFNYTLPKLTQSRNYTIFVMSTDGQTSQVSADLTVKTSPFLVSFSGPLWAGAGYDMIVNVKSVNSDLIDKSMNFTNRTWNTNFTLPNLLMNCDFDITATVVSTEEGLSDSTIRYSQNPALYNALKSKIPNLDPANSGRITPQELKSVKGVLNLSRCNLTSVEGLQNCTEVTHLYIDNNSISDISPLLTLSNLTYLDASNNNITYLYRISPYLKFLNLSGNNISSIDPLKHTDTIVHLDIASNGISDVSPIKNYGFLRYLDIRSNNITDISPLPKRRYANLLTSNH